MLVEPAFCDSHRPSSIYQWNKGCIHWRIFATLSYLLVLDVSKSFDRKFSLDANFVSRQFLGKIAGDIVWIDRAVLFFSILKSEQKSLVKEYLFGKIWLDFYRSPVNLSNIIAETRCVNDQNLIQKMNTSYWWIYYQWNGGFVPRLTFQDFEITRRKSFSLLAEFLSDRYGSECGNGENFEVKNKLKDKLLE